MILVQSIIFEHTFYQEAFNMKESSKNCVEYEVIKRASFSPKKVIETVATDVGKSQFIRAVRSLASPGMNATEPVPAEE